MSEAGQLIKTVTVPDPELLAALAPLPENLSVGVWDLLGDPEGVALAEIDAVVLPYATGIRPAAVLRAPRLKLVHTQSTGFDGIPALVGPDVAVASAAGVHAAATAELAIGLMLASLRGIDQAARDQPLGRWNSARWPGLADRRVLLLGVGGIGKEIARRLEPFEVGLTRVGSTARDDDAGHVHGVDELEALAAGAEILVIITPLSEATRGLVGARVLAALPDGALVVNVARGAVVDSAALTAEVVSGRLRCAIDVFDPEPIPADHPLWRSPNALITPHVGGNTAAFTPRIIKLLRAQLVRLAAGERPENLVQAGPFGR